MKVLFYDEWCKKRTDKIISILGANWFAGKHIIELGCAHGDIGKQFLRLGAEVTFSDIKQEYLDDIQTELLQLNHIPRTLQLDQETSYNLNRVYDLVLHMSVLSHVINWKQDLSSVLKFTDLMILETHVNSFPINHELNSKQIVRTTSSYSNNNRVEKHLINQEEIESFLIESDCKFLRLDSKELNTNWCWDGSELLRHIYDWDYESAQYHMHENNRLSSIGIPRMTHFRRMYLVIK